MTAEKWIEFPSQTMPNGRRVGVAWAGNPNYKADRQRSIKLSTLLPLLQSANVTWVALQKGSPAEELAALPDGVAVLDGSSHDRDLAETAALLATLDLVITTDTCIAHLAGAMDKPVWILLPHLADWRWMQQTETTPWYPAARLIRQRHPGDWDGVVRQILEELGGLPEQLRQRGPTLTPTMKPIQAATELPRAAA
jgi:ADP-heptose:LPS heptosyltransferase